MSLKDARLARDAARLRVKGDRSIAGVDIVRERQKAREEAKAVDAKVVLSTFEECAEAYIRANWSTWSEKHRDQWPSSLERYANPTIGRLTGPEIKPSQIHDLLKPIWVEKRETANRVRGRIETIIAKNVDIDDADFRNPREKLPKRPKRVVRHHPALPYIEAPAFMKQLAGASGTAAENAMLAVLDRLGCGHVTVHGFRSTFATWAEECTDYPDGVREAALAHKYESETTAAYHRGQKLEKRRALMKDWAVFLGGANVSGLYGQRTG
ncbi:integrase [Bradyrhizobium sp. CW9]|uniref:tyrosine-type recombinase/integrase n=1 Tax=Bradyrhizobium sp. CW9 TaxID=2782689 RepID=UPI001FFBBBD6|nr:integrase [Bradyrhizobium sp. CW9]